jgi:type I restriction enzyme S subunit
MSDDFKLPRSWVRTSIEKIVFNQKGKKPKILNEVEFNDSIPYLDIKAFEKKEFRRFGDKKSSVIVDENDVVMVWDGARSGLVGKGIYGALGSTLMRLKPFIVSPEFLFHFLNSKFSYLNSNTKGTGIPHVDPSVLWGIEFPLPPLEEQKLITSKIEELLSGLDNGEEDLRLGQSQLELYRLALLKNAFSGELTKEWRKENTPMDARRITQQIKERRNKTYEEELRLWNEEIKAWEVEGKIKKRPLKPRLPSEFPDLSPSQLSQLPQIPKNWVWEKLGNVCLKVMDGTHFSPKNYPEGDYMYITAKNIQEGRIDLENITYVSEEDHKVIYARCDVQRGDVLYIKDGATTGRAAVNDIDEEFSLLSSVGVFRTFQDLLIPKYLEYYLNSGITRDRMLSKVAGVAITRLTLVKLNNSSICICSPKEQEKIIEILETQFSIIDNLNKTIEIHLEKSRALRQSILKKAFEGKLVNQVTNTEPASDLLLRIEEQKKKYLESILQQKKSTKKVKRMKNSLIGIIENEFDSSEFTFEELRSSSKMKYEDLKHQLFELLEKGEKLKSSFDATEEIIKYQILK